MRKAKTIFFAGMTAVLIGLLAFLGVARTVYAADYTWDNGSVADNNWSTPANWNPDGTPNAGDNVIFDATSDTGCIADNVNDNLASISLNAGFTSTLTLNADFVGGTSNELTLTGDLTVNSGIVLCMGDTSTANGTGIVINAANMTVGENGLVSANGQGFGPTLGPGHGIRGVGNIGTGGGYGGSGGKDMDGDAGGSPYGTQSSPAALGSGGGTGLNATGGYGGGAVKLVASGTVTVDGTLSANGTGSGGSRTYNGGAGSGGSIWIASGTVTGSGTISVKGATVNRYYGIRYAGGGAGGRIDLSGITYNFTGSLTAAGGSGFQDGQLGSVLLPASYLNNVTLDHNITLGNDLNITGSFTVETGATLTTGGDITVGTTLTVNSGGAIILVGDTHDVNGGTAGNPNGSGPTITAADIVIASGGSIHADGQGFDGQQGPGRGIRGAGNLGSGGGYGGNGGKDMDGDAGGSPYGTASAPTALGSGGGRGNRAQGGFGGGVIK
ncbi:MAG: hypothetical protein JRF69_13365, partial [Deltaproteobacteria bacterium]|nr:hypothetical protein [Deltaproteobacteria bacterium]